MTASAVSNSSENEPKFARCVPDFVIKQNAFATRLQKEWQSLFLRLRLRHRRFEKTIDVAYSFFVHMFQFSMFGTSFTILQIHPFIFGVLAGVYKHFRLAVRFPFYEK